MPTTMHRSAFIKALRSALPDVEPWLDGYRDNITLEMTRVLDFTRAALKARDYDRVTKCFQFIERAYRNGNKEVRNSIVVTFLEHLDFGEPPDMRAQSILSTELSAVRNRALKALRDLERR